MSLEKAFKSGIFLSALCLMIGHEGFARQDIIPGSRYTSARGAALGDAFLPLGEDGGSILFYNPANIGKLNQAQLEPADIELYAGSGLLSNISATSYNIYDLNQYAANLKQAPNAFESFGGAFLSSFSSRYFTVGVLTSMQTGAQYNPAVNTIRYKSIYQFIPAVATGVRLAEGIVRLGYSLQWVNQALGDITVPATATGLAYNAGLLQGAGFSHTLGAALTLPLTFLPSLNIVCRNFLGTQYTLGSVIPFSPNPSGTPGTEPMTFDGSFSVQPKLGGGALLNLVFEWRDFLNASNILFMGHLSMGIELAIRETFFARAGWGSGYPNFGLGLKRKNGELSLTYYSEEVGPAYGAQQDSRFLIEYRVRAF